MRLRMMGPGWSQGLALGAVLAGAFLSGGCFLFSRGVALNYELSKEIVKTARKTPVSVILFVDKREDPGLIGQSTNLGFLKEPVRARGNVAAWATKVMIDELSAMGYKILPEADWKVGGSVKEVNCTGGRKVSCVIELDLWVRMKGNWQILRHDYKGEGAMPPLYQEADLYELSLTEAMRELMANFRRDFELAVP